MPNPFDDINNIPNSLPTPLFGEFFKTIEHYDKNSIETKTNDVVETIKRNKPSIDVKRSDLTVDLNKVYINIQLTKDQLDLISKSVEIMTRLGVLQLSNAILPCIKESENFSFIDNKQKIIILLKQVRNLLIENNSEFEEYINDMGDWSLGIANKNVPNEVRIAGELHHAIEHFKYLSGDNTVDDKYHDQLQKISTIPDITINIIEKS